MREKLGRIASAINNACAADANFQWTAVGDLPRGNHSEASAPEHFIEESLCRGLTWAVRAERRTALLNVGAFMHNLFRQGAFQGATPRDACFVRCDSTTTTQNDRILGIVNVIVGFAPLEPAEFIVLHLQQIAGQIQT